MKIILTFILMFFISLTSHSKSTIKLVVKLTPAGSFEAVSERLKGNLINRNGVFSADKIWVSIESLKTGIDLRDEHLWKHFQSTKHPKAVLTNMKGQNGRATGILEVNGVKRSVNMVYKEIGQEIKTLFRVKASEFNLPKAKYLGVGVSDDIRVEATYPFVRK